MSKRVFDPATGRLLPGIPHEIRFERLCDIDYEIQGLTAERRALLAYFTRHWEEEGRRRAALCDRPREGRGLSDPDA